MKDLLALLAIIALAAVYGFFPAYVMLDLMKLVNVPVLDQFSLIQMYILMMAVRMVVINKVGDKKEDPDKVISEWFGKTLKSALIIAITWGLAYLVYAVVK